MILLVLLLGLILRLISLNQSLWLDEAINILYAKQFSLPLYLTKYLQEDFHPPGYLTLIWIWTHIFGFSEIAARIPSVIFGIITIWYVYKLGSLIKDKQLGLIAALLVAVNPLQIYYSQEARMYEFAAMTSAASFYYFLKLQNQSSFGFLKYAAATVLLLSSDYLAGLTIVAELIVLAYTQSRQWWKQVVKGWILVGLVGIGLLPILINQLHIGIDTTKTFPVWKEVVGEASFKSLALTAVKFILGRISFYNKYLYGVIAGGMGVIFAGLMARGFVKKEKFTPFLLCWLLVPILISFVISFWVPIYSYTRVLFTLAPLILLVSIGVSSLSKRWQLLVLFGIVGLQIVFASIYLLNPNFQREDWRGMVDFLERSPNTPVLFESNDAFAPFRYYAERRLPVVGGLAIMPAREASDVADLESKLADAKMLFLVDYLVDITDPKRLVSEKIVQLGYSNTETIDFHGIGLLYKYQKK